MREELQQACEQADKHMDEAGVPADSLFRGLAKLQLALNASPVLEHILRTNYPHPESLLL
jgi:hypothetical protein